ncbi:MAG: hypothetical protein WCP28_15025 [Actinomycetes bacterium]
MTYPSRSDEDRPVAVVVVAMFTMLAAVVLAASVISAIVLLVRPGEYQEFAGAPVSDWYWAISAALSLVMCVIYVRIAAGLLNRNPQAWLLVNVFALINIFYALFQTPFGTGWAELVINIILLIINNTNDPRVWFQR